VGVQGNPQGRAGASAGAGIRTGASAGTRTWPTARPTPPWGTIWPQIELAIPARLRAWAAIEVGAGRLLPWFAVAFGAGIVLYFTADHEPALWAASAAAAATAMISALLRRRPVGFALGLGVFAVAAGFAVATLKTVLIGHPILHYPGIMAQLPAVGP
jgi:competence protein ComEC